MFLERESTANRAGLMLLCSVAIVLSGCQHNPPLSNVQKEAISHKITDYCTQGSNAIAKQDIPGAQKSFLLATQQLGGEDLLPMAWALEGLAFTEYTQNQLAPSALHFQKAITIYEAPPRGPMNPALMRPLVSLGRVYHSQNKDADARSVFIRAVQIGAFNGPKVNTDAYMRSLLELGNTYLLEGQLSEAETLLRRALDLKKYESQPNERRIAEVNQTLTTVLEKKKSRQTSTTQHNM